MSNKPKIRKVVIVGGGSAGWMTAAALTKVLGTQNYDITLIESKDIGTVGVGEASIPQMALFNRVLGVGEDEFMSETNGTIKLGIHFVNWRNVGVEYFHPFGLYGVDMDGINFMHFWQRDVTLGGTRDYTVYNSESMAAMQNRFDRPRATDTNALPRVNYAYQFDATLYANFLRRHAEKRGLVRQEGKIVKVNQDAASGYVTSVQLESGQVVGGDLFIDCSGFRGLLIEQALHSGYEDWSKWLPCNRAVAVPYANPEGPITPYTRATAREAGWEWRIPLQTRIGGGYVFCDAYLSEDEAREKFISRIAGAALAEPAILKFVGGHRRQMWNRNVVSIGLAAGFLEPLESTSIHLGQAGIAKLLALFPKRGFNQAVIDQFNREMLAEYVNVRDFLIAHYKTTEREDTPFWKYCKYMDIPDSLAARLEVFRTQGQCMVQEYEIFKEVSWFAVLLGQGLHPEDYHPVADVISEDELKLRLSRIRAGVKKRVDGLMSHDDFLKANCPARMRPVMAV
ncbi:MAG: tryptophan 7-halogenase [Asticcacaulis sp.]|uniref:tryptophan halogenase family protein n=1 Tax=Asticcacaulis sp. TaxID=1872648 RepID=UPI0039E4D623